MDEPLIPPALNVQWKGTDVCLDFQCTCSDPDDAYEYHFDGYTFGRFQCPRCGQVWVLSQPVVTPETPEEAARWVGSQTAQLTAD